MLRILDDMLFTKTLKDFTDSDKLEILNCFTLERL